MFLAEGLPCIALGLLTLRVLPDKPDQARWLSDDEKQVLQRETAPTLYRADSFRAVLKNPDLCARAGLLQHHLSDLCDQFLAADLVQGTGREQYDAPRLLHRDSVYRGGSLHVSRGPQFGHGGRTALPLRISALAGALCLIAAIFADGNLVATLVAPTAATACLWTAYTVFWTILSELVHGTAAAGGIALINTVGLSSGFWGPAVIGRTKVSTGSVHAGLFVMACAATVAAVLILTGKLTLKR